MSYQSNPGPNPNYGGRPPEQAATNFQPNATGYGQSQPTYQSPGQMPFTPSPQTYGYSAPPVRSSPLNYRVWSFMLVAVSGLVMTIATFLPWYQYQNISVNGLGQMSGYNSSSYSSSAVGLGGLTLIPGIMLIVFGGIGALTKTRELATLSTLICVQFLILVGFAVILISSVVTNQYSGSSSSSYNGSNNILNIGLGVFLGIIGAIVGLAGGVWSMVQHRSAT